MDILGTGSRAVTEAGTDNIAELNGMSTGRHNKRDPIVKKKPESFSDELSIVKSLYVHYAHLEVVFFYFTKILMHALAVRTKLTLRPLSTVLAAMNDV